MRYNEAKYSINGAHWIFTIFVLLFEISSCETVKLCKKFFLALTLKMCNTTGPPIHKIQTANVKQLSDIQ